MKCSLDISYFLEEISSLSHFIVSLYFFAFFIKEGFLTSPCYSLELCIQMGISLLFFFAFHFSSFHSYLQGPLRYHFAFLHFCPLGDGIDHCLLYNAMNFHQYFFRHSVYQIYSLESFCHFHCIDIRDLI